MSSRLVIITGLIVSLLLIFLCIFFNAKRYYKELELGTTNGSLVSTPTTPVIKSVESNKSIAFPDTSTVQSRNGKKYFKLAC